MSLLFSGCAGELYRRVPSLASNSVRVYYLVGLQFDGNSVTGVLTVSPASISGEGLELGRHVMRRVNSLNRGRDLSL